MKQVFIIIFYVVKLFPIIDEHEHFITFGNTNHKNKQINKNEKQCDRCQKKLCISCIRRMISTAKWNATAQ